MSDLTDKFAIYAIGGAAAAATAFGFYEAGTHIMSSVQHNTMSPEARIILKILAAGATSVVSGIGMFALGAEIHRYQEIGALRPVKFYGALGLVGGCLGGWFGADKVLPPPHYPNQHSAIIQQAAPNESRANALAKLPAATRQMVAQIGA